MGRVEGQFQGIVLQIIHDIIGEDPALPFDALPLQEEARSDVLIRLKENFRSITVIRTKRS